MYQELDNFQRSYYVYEVLQRPTTDNNREHSRANQFGLREQQPRTLTNRQHDYLRPVVVEEDTNTISTDNSRQYYEIPDY